MDQGVAVSGAVLNDPEIQALDRTLPRVVAAFDPGARQRILAGIGFADAGGSPGYALLSRRLMHCAKSSPEAMPANAGMRRVMRHKVVTFDDVERLMEAVGRSAGEDDVREAIERLQVEAGFYGDPGRGLEDGADPKSDILELCLNKLGSQFGLHGFRPTEPQAVETARDGDLDLDFGGLGDDPFEEEARIDRTATFPGTRPAARVESLWDHAFRQEFGAGDGDAMANLTGTMQVAVVTGYKGDPKALCQAAGASLAGSTQQPVLGLVVVDEESLLKSKNHGSPAKVEALVRSVLDDGNSVIFNSAGGTIPAFVDAHAAHRVHLASCHGVLRRVVQLLADDGVDLPRVRGGYFQAWLRANVDDVPFSRANAVRAWLRHAYDAGRVDASAEDTLVRLASLRLHAPAPRRPGPQTLEEVRGLDATVSRRLRRISGRLASPDGGGVGILLAGPPGTGKTLIAGILARQSNRHFVNCSLSEGQASGYLNDFLSAIRGAFEEARRNAPSLLFIDEADSIGHRGATGNRNDDYWNMVVNCLLECLQGLGERGDVTVVAASNHPGLIDPAILREGRIGETIEIPLPTRAGRAEILGSLLPEAHALGLDLQALSDRLGACSPAALEGLVREARLQAKEAGATLDASHIDAALRDSLKADAHPRSLTAVAIGLAAEAVMLRTAYGDEARILAISAEPGLADRGRVTVDFASGQRPSGTASDSLRALHVALAPAAGRFVVASNGRRDDPFACFTNLSAAEQAWVRLHALDLVDSGALSGASGPDPLMRDELARRIAGQAWLQVLKVLRRDRKAIEAVYEALVARGRLDGDLFARIASGDPVPTVH
jgi:DNA polymerase III delta prime subunit